MYVVAGLLLVVLYILAYIKGRETWTKIVREVAYGAISYSFEQSAYLAKKGQKQTPEQKLALAVSYMKAEFPLMSRKQAEMQCVSMLAKVVGAGSTGSAKV